MKIPKKLKIGGHIYEVKMVDFADDTGGDIDEKRCVIRLDKNQQPSQLGMAVIHEILGTCNSTMHDEEHALLASLAEQLYQVLSDNDMLK